MPKRIWTSETSDGEEAEYHYHESETGCWASRKIGEIANTYIPAPPGLTDEEVEDLFEN